MKTVFRVAVLCSFAAACGTPEESSSGDLLDVVDDSLEVQPQLLAETLADGDAIGPAGTTALKVGAAISVAEGAAVRVPAPGSAVTVVIDLVSGSSEVTVSNEGGVVKVERIASEAAAAKCSSPPACDDSTFNVFGYKWNDTLNWHFASQTAPSASRDAYETAFKQAVSNMTTGHDDCGITGDQISATQHYAGRVAGLVGAEVFVGIDGKLVVICGEGDRQSRVGFGQLPVFTNGIVLGFACVQHHNNWPITGHVADEADIVLNKDARWFSGINGVPSGCSGRHSVEAVATHEFGHAFGLAHVSECSHGNLTMSKATSACSNAASTLGRGDVRGLRSLY